MRLINKLARLHNKILMLVLSILIFVLFIIASVIGVSFTLSSPLVSVILGLWVLFALISSIYSINGLLLDKVFQKQLKRQQSLGKPLEGVRGFDEFREGMLYARNFSILVTVGSIFSLIIFILAITGNFDFAGNSDNLRALLVTFALTFAFITITLLFLIEYPEEVNFNPGGLIGFYEPDEYPMLLDNIIYDTFVTFLDPITYVDIEEWGHHLFSLLSDEFEPDETPTQRLEQARERVLLMLYLHSKSDDLVNDRILNKELAEVVGEDNLDQLFEGIETGLTLFEIQSIIKRIDSLSPESFRLVDRLLGNLADDYQLFIQNDLYFTVSTKTNQGSVRESTGIIAYFLNNSEKEDRNVHVTLRGGRNLIQPDFQEIKLELDTLTDPYPQETPKLIDDEKDDILGVLTDILSVGDAVWFRINPIQFGYKVITIQAESNDGRIFGRSFEMRFRKSIRYYAKNYLPKLSGAASIVLPLLQGYLGLQL